jgi:hypothetical protein
MDIRILEAIHRSWPDEAHMTATLEAFSLSLDRLISALTSCVHTASPYQQGGLQQFLAATIARHLETTLTTSYRLSRADERYSPELNETADLALAHGFSEPRIFFEVEFRPNVEKDLVKFQIGVNRGTLAAAVLILAIDRNNINWRYYTMPEYRKFERIIEELQPNYPLLLLGVRIGNDAA